jgi:hypothetical protein
LARTFKGSFVTGLRDARHLSNQEELALMDRLAESLFAYHATAQYFSRKMRERTHED